MIRDKAGDRGYWDKWISFNEEAISKVEDALTRPSGNPAYRAQFAWDLSKEYTRLILRRYCRGDAIRELPVYFDGLLHAWERSNRFAAQICLDRGLPSCRDWDFNLSNLNHYNYCFWLVGLALALDVTTEQWSRLIALIGDEERDLLLDRVIAKHSPQRRIGKELLHPKPYSRLMMAVDATPDTQAALLLDFVENWYSELNRPTPKNSGEPSCRPYWYDFGDQGKVPLESGSYFGRWCIEAVATVKAFQLDDQLCLGREYYPGDLLRPDGPSTHRSHRSEEKGGSARGLKGIVSKILGKPGE
ncbi:hypothetical protein PTKU64_61900 [Paraburkholderia terrae]|uniref:DUF1911 domain-containing protein n=1 Tax=Paraburkholderia terrae TaxID=311230 RepID=A0ABM7U720_9BURK|nr:PoNe immunity protein domain-containing protein [Paraburkholderia terrae]BCZ82515.1 hypothetical protein PTKU64_61900 [Paraburkholderia terrae]